MYSATMWHHLPFCRIMRRAPSSDCCPLALALCLDGGFFSFPPPRMLGRPCLAPVPSSLPPHAVGLAIRFALPPPFLKFPSSTVGRIGFLPLPSCSAVRLTLFSSHPYPPPRLNSRALTQRRQVLVDVVVRERIAERCLPPTWSGILCLRLELLYPLPELVDDLPLPSSCVQLVLDEPQVLHEIVHLGVHPSLELVRAGPASAQ
mmetsp:Transcript_20510/g.68639  ORF Transcript_20510/g.68639 Transcript_20510/m.68639 type:complete len:204 (+) Transcript_20510:207-818(+)